MLSQKPSLTRAEITRSFESNLVGDFPPILSPSMLAHLLGLSRKTIYAWIAAGRLDGCFRKRGKHVLIWRDKAVDVLFNGKSWSDYE